VYVQVCTLYRCFWTSVYISGTHPPQCVHVRSCMRCLSLALGEKVGGLAILCRALVAGVRRFY